MENSQLVSKKNIIRYGYGIAAGVIALISGEISRFSRDFLPNLFPFEYFQISYIVIAILIFTSLFLSKRYLIPGLVLMSISFVISVINDLIFLVSNFWKLYNILLAWINLLFISNFLLIGINIGDLAKIWKFDRSS